MRKLALGMAMAALVVSASAAHADLLTNGSFESGDFTGWTEGGNFEFSQVATGPFYDYAGAQDGAFYGTFGPVGSDASLSQTFSDSPGATLTVSFWINAVGDAPSDFAVLFNSETIVDAIDPSLNGWTMFSGTFTATGSDTIQLLVRDDPGYIAFDNFSVTEGGAVPEPISIALFGAGLAGLGATRRRKSAS